MTDFDEHERDVLANMFMRSLRGSWIDPEPRAKLLEEIAEEGLSDYDEGRIIDRVESFLNPETYRDGRTFRGIYQDGPRVYEQTDEQTVKNLTGHLPLGDATWNAISIERRFEDND